MPEVTEFTFPRFVEEAVQHDHFFIRKNLANAGWDGCRVAVQKDRLSARQEQQLFSAMQVAGYLACKHKGRISPFTKRGQKHYSLYQSIFSFLVQQNIGLIHVTVSRSSICAPNKEDLTAEGYHALFNAVRNFNPWKGFRFSTYACNAIKKSCWKFSTKQLKKSHKPLTETDVENLTYEVPIETLEDPRMLLELILDRTFTLTKREAGILRERYMTGRIKTLEEVGVKIGITREWVRRIQIKAIRKIQKTITSDEY